ncbi:MAG: phytanoyl-CoA dioxygenase family protein [Pseudomonadales bacterium]
MTMKNLSHFDQGIDLAKKYPKTTSVAAELYSDEDVQAELDCLLKNGYVILPNLISEKQLEEIQRGIEPLLNRTGRNAFEGVKTQRVYALLNKTLACNPLAEYPLVLALLDRILDPGYLLSQLQVINIQPGEAQQESHHDDSFYPFARPRPHLGAATIWALDDFTAKNGGTLVIPGSHRWGDEKPEPFGDHRQIACEMPAGSCVMFLGTLWHSGGANQSTAPRLSVTAQYCQPYLRTQENYSMSVPKEIVAQCSEDMKRMLGYSIFASFMGMVDGKHPKRLLERTHNSSDNAERV